MALEPLLIVRPATGGAPRGRWIVRCCRPSVIATI
jgi:hypothetical protein